jgi:predicted DNA-binding protein YlxM (UPF0122 family)
MIRRRRKISKNQEKEIIDKYSEGISTEVICIDYNVCSSTIVDVLRRNSIIIDQYKTRTSKLSLDVPLISEMYMNNISLENIAKQFNVSTSIIRNRLKSNNVKIRDKNSKIIIEDNIKNKIIELYENHNSMSQISKITNYSTWIIGNILKENNINIRTKDDEFRKEISRKNMTNRFAKYKSIRIGYNEEYFIQKLKLIYKEVIPQYQIEISGHHFDVYAGNILWEYDEEHHRWKRQIEKDIRYDKKAKELGYEVRRITDKNFKIYGLDIWHNYQ